MCAFTEQNNRHCTIKKTFLANLIHHVIRIGVVNEVVIVVYARCSGDEHTPEIIDEAFNLIVITPVVRNEDCSTNGVIGHNGASVP